MARYKFQIENGNIADGNTMILIKDNIAEIEDVTPATELLIEAHGGLLVEEARPKAKRKPKSERGEDS